jgi:phage repressor protein C with HTH and peptisase S24 domain
MSMIDRLKSVMGNMTQVEFAAEIGVSPQAVSQWFSGNTEPTRQNIQKICKRFNVDVNWLSFGGGLLNSDVEPVYITQNGNAVAGNSSLGLPPLASRDLPVYAAAEGGDGELVVSVDPIEIVPRPWYLGEVKDGYAVLITGYSMSPEFEPGDMAIVNPKLPHMRGKVHIFATERDDGHFLATIKRLVKATPEEWIVEQHNPVKTFSLNRQQWTTARRVVGKYSG